MKNFKKKSNGFSLMELMIVVAIIGILTAIAYPAYTSHVVKTRRAEGQAALAHLASLMERYFSNNNTYATATIAAGNPTTDVLTSDMTAENWYQLSITAQTATAYTLQATPQGDQATEDTLCANLTLNSLAVKGFSGTGTLAQCW